MKRLVICVAAILAALCIHAKDYKLVSPDGKIEIAVSCASELTWSVSKCGNVLLEPSPLALTLTDGTVFGKDVKVRKIARKSVSQVLDAQNFKASSTTKKPVNGIKACITPKVPAINKDFFLLISV